MQKVFGIVAILISLLHVTVCLLDIKTVGGNLERDGQIWHDKCMVITGATEAMIDDIKKGVFDEKLEVMKQYVSCLWILSGALDKDFNLTQDKFVYYLPGDWLKKLSPSYKKCLTAAKSKSDLSFREKVYDMLQCNFKENPETFIVM